MKSIIGITLVAVLPLSACAGSAAASASVSEPAPERSIAVNTAIVSTGSISSELSYAGQVRAAEHIAIMSRVPGMVDQVMVDVGDFVEAGDILFTMDAVDLRNNIDSLRAQLATAEAAVNAARTGVNQADGSAMQQQRLQASGSVTQTETGLIQAETNMEQAALSLSQAQNAYNIARQNHNDTSSLFAAGVVPRSQLDQVEMALTNSEIALQQALNNHQIAASAFQQAENSHQQAVQSYQIVSGNMVAENRQRAQDGLAQATAQRNSLQVNLRAAEERLDDAAVRSPISGVIGSRSVEPQTMLGQGAAPFTVVSTDMVLIGVEVTETIINRIQVGQEVNVHIGAASIAPFLGEVSTVSPAANEMTSTFSIEIAVDNSEGTIRPGMFAEVFFTRERSDYVVVVPRAAVLVENGQPVVYLAKEERAVRREVSTGIDTGTHIEIIAGLSAGEQLIVTGQAFVTDGVSILVVESGGNA